MFCLVPDYVPLLTRKVEWRYGQATLRNLRRDRTAPRQIHCILEVTFPHWRVRPCTDQKTECLSQGCPYSLHTWIHCPFSP